MVIDIGSTYTKVGLSNREEPSKIFPTIVGNPRFERMMVQKQKETDLFVGREVWENSGIVRSKYPVRRGIIRDWNLFKSLLSYTITAVPRITPAETPILIAYPPVMSRNMVEHIAEILFEEISVPSVLACSHPYLIKQEISEETSLIVESGGEVSTVTPVIEGRELLALSDSIPIAGEDVTKRLSNLLKLKGHSFDSPGEMKMVREMKEDLCYFTLDIEKEEKKSSKRIGKTYTLPDGRDIEISKERFKSPEVIYQPRKVGRRVSPLHEKIYEVIQNCSMTQRPRLIQNIVLSGGNTLIPRFKERLQKELVGLLPEGMKEKLSLSHVSNPSISVWEGGKITATTVFDKIKTTKEEWDKSGSIF